MINKYCIEYTSHELQVLKQVGEENKVSHSDAMSKLLQVKDRIKLFEHINNHEIIHLVKDVKFQKFQRKEIIIQKGDIKKEIFILLSGDTHIILDRKIIANVTPGQIIGEIAAIFDKPRNATVICSSKDALLLSFKLNKTMIDEVPKASAYLYKNLAEQINIKLELQNKAFVK